MNEQSLDLLETLRTDKTKSGVYLNELAQEFPFGVLKLLQRMQAINIHTIGFAFSHRNVSNELFQQFLHDSFVLQMKTREDAMIVVKVLSTEDLKKSIREACGVLNTPPKVIVEPVVEKIVEVKPKEIVPVVKLSRFEQDQLRYNALPEEFRNAAEWFKFSEPQVIHRIVISNQESKSVRLNTRLLY